MELVQTRWRIHAILGGVLGALPMVESTHSYFVMEEVKESTRLELQKP